MAWTSLCDDQFLLVKHEKFETIIISVKAAKITRREDGGINDFLSTEITHVLSMAKVRCLDI